MPSFDPHKNFGYSTVATAPSPAGSGTSLVVQSGDGAGFPSTPFNAVIWPVGALPRASNAEVVRVTGIATDTLTIVRTQETSSARTVVIGDQIAAAETAKVFTDIEGLLVPVEALSSQTVPASAQLPYYGSVKLDAGVQITMGDQSRWYDVKTPATAESNVAPAEAFSNYVLDPGVQVAYHGSMILDAGISVTLGDKTRVFDAMQSVVSEPQISLTDITTGNVSISAHGFAPKAPNSTSQFLRGDASYAAVTDANLSVSDVTTNDVTTGAHGFAPKAPADSTKFLRGDATWAVPAATAAASNAMLVLTPSIGTASDWSKTVVASGAFTAGGSGTGVLWDTTATISSSIDANFQIIGSTGVNFRDPQSVSYNLSWLNTGTDFDVFFGTSLANNAPTVGATGISTYSNNQYGFKWNRTASGTNTLSATNGNGTTETATALTLATNNVFSAKQSSTDTKYYVGRALVATQTTNQPSGVPGLYLRGCISNRGVATQTRIAGMWLSYVVDMQ